MMSNPRFPHTCTISRTEGDTQLGTSTTTMIYKGSCRKGLNNQKDAPVGSASTAQWILSLPITFKIKFGDKVIVDDGVAELKGNVSDWQVTNIEHLNSGGVLTEDINGSNTSLDGTTTKGFHIYVNMTKN